MSCGQYNQNKALATNPTDIDKSWLTGQPCQAPCWYGLIPGTSTKNDVIEKTKHLSFINSLGIEESQHSRWNGKFDEIIKTVNLPCINPKNQSCTNIELKEDVIDSIMIFPNFNITFKEAVESIGTPDLIYYSPKNPEVKDCRLGMVWSNQKLDVTYYQNNTGLFKESLCDLIKKNDEKIPSNLVIQEIIYWDENMFSENIKNGSFHQWNGFINE